MTGQQRHDPVGGGKPGARKLGERGDGTVLIQNHDRDVIGRQPVGRSGVAQQQPGIGITVILLSFAVVVIGGLGSVEGAAIAALFVGFARAAAIHLVPWAELFIVYLVMALVLAFRPEGLFQRTSARKI